MNHNRNRHSKHMNAYKASVVANGKPIVIGKTLYFERTLEFTTLVDGVRTILRTAVQRVRALGKDEQPDEQEK